jgi:hypothetical protein
MDRFVFVMVAGFFGGLIGDLILGDIGCVVGVCLFAWTTESLLSRSN